MLIPHSAVSKGKAYILLADVDMFFTIHRLGWNTGDPSLRMVQLEEQEVNDGII
jgi:hypothetical protein